MYSPLLDHCFTTFVLFKTAENTLLITFINMSYMRLHFSTYEKRVSAARIVAILVWRETLAGVFESMGDINFHAHCSLALIP